MPWREICSMDEKMRLMAALAAEEESVSELCEDFGISRKTAYKWWRRYLEFGPEGLKERSHAPQVVPWAISEAQAEAISGLRRAHPSWGPRKLRAQTRPMRARSELAGAEHDWRVAAPPTTQSAAQAAKKRQTIAASVAHGIGAQRHLVYRLQGSVPHRRWRALRSLHPDRRLQSLPVERQGGR